MRIPDELEDKIANEINNIKLTDLRNTAKILSDRYMNAKRTGQSLLNKNLEVLAYSIIRMPATFCAINKAIEETLKRYNPNIKTVMNNTNNEQILTLNSGITKLRIYMWIEGQDVDCEDNASYGDISFSLEFTTNPA